MTEIVARLPFAPNIKMKHGGPLVRIPTIWFELDKHYTETRMQLTLSDSDLIFDSSNVKFSGLQYRGFAFFSLGFKFCDFFCTKYFSIRN